MICVCKKMYKAAAARLKAKKIWKIHIKVQNKNKKILQKNWKRINKIESTISTKKFPTKSFNLNSIFDKKNR
jgi:hypothetical protein